MHQIDALDLGLEQSALPQQGDQLKPAALRLDPGYVLHHRFLLVLIFNVDSS
jgi:hypothetical protein